MNRFEDEVRARGMTVFAYIDHAGSAAAAGLLLDPTDLLIFGNAQGSAPSMQKTQTVGIDLPLKALVWQDPTGPHSRGAKPTGRTHVADSVREAVGRLQPR